jgi:hypothetical protein
MMGKKTLPCSATQSKKKTVKSQIQKYVQVKLTEKKGMQKRINGMDKI